MLLSMCPEALMSYLKSMGATSMEMMLSEVRVRPRDRSPANLET